MSWITFVAVSLCLSCVLAQSPPVPMMPDTFQATGEVEFHGTETTDFGQFMIARDQAKEMGFEREEYDRRGGEVTEALLRYDTNKTYYLRGSKEAPHCLEEDRNFNGMPKFWDWLTYAKYEGTVQVREIDYDVWGTNIGGVRFEFGKPKSNSSIVYFYRHKSTESSTFYSFFKFMTTPDSSLFDVPKECKVN